jgi:hypothetical protein
MHCAELRSAMCAKSNLHGLNWDYSCPIGATSARRTVVRIDNNVFITLKNVSGDGDNSMSVADFILRREAGERSIQVIGK